MRRGVRPQYVQEALAVRIEQLRAERERARDRADSLQAKVAASQARLLEVRALERRRLVHMITDTTQRDLNDVRERLWRLRDLLIEGLPTQPAVGALADVRSALAELLDAFRVTVRGVFPAMLPERGAQAALEELAATLPGTVRFDGDLGRRVDWHIESGFYHAVAAVLQQVAGQTSAAAVTVVFGRDSGLQARVAARGVPDDALHVALDHEAARLAVIGGEMTLARTEDCATVDVRLPERVEMVDVDAALPRYDYALYRQVWELVRLGRHGSGSGPDRQRWDAVAERLSKPPRLAVIRAPGGDDAARTAVPASATPHISVVEVAAGAPDAALAAEFLAEDGPRGAVDAVVCLVPASAEFRAALRSGGHQIMLGESGQLVRRVVALAPVIAARRAIVALRDLVSELPPENRVRRELDRIVAEGHELAGLELLSELDREDSRVFANAEFAAAARRLLGEDGTDPIARLGLPGNAPDSAVRAAAISAAQSWRSRAGAPTAGGRERAACELLARTAERLLAHIG